MLMELTRKSIQVWADFRAKLTHTEFILREKKANTQNLDEQLTLIPVQDMQFNVSLTRLTIILIWPHARV